MGEVTVRLTWPQVFLGAMVGVMRRMESRKSDRQDNHGYSPEAPWDDEIESAIAEMAAAKERGVFWDATLCNFKNADLGADKQVRHTKRQGGSLIIRPEDSDDHRYILVVGIAPDYRVCGWIWGHEAKQERWLRSPNNRPPAYFVPQEVLREMGDLDEPALS